MHELSRHYSKGNHKKVLNYATYMMVINNLTGNIVIKSVPIPPGNYYLTVVSLIRNSDGLILLQLTSPEKLHKWSLTGGHPKSGESSINGIINEIKEELGLDVKKCEVELLKTKKTEDDFLDFYFIKKDIKINDLRLQKEEVESVGWFAIDEIKTLIKNHNFLPAHIDIFYEYLKYIE